MGFGAKAIADIPFLWLDGPKGGSAGRDNKNDPKSPLFVPTNTPGPVATATPSGPTNTPTNTLTFTNTYTPIPPTATPTPVIDSKDPADNSAGGATPLTGASTASAAQTDNGHYVGASTDPDDYFVMTLTVGQTYTFTATRTSGVGTLSIEVRDSADTIIGSANTSAGSPTINLNASATTYYVVVRASGGALGYNFTYQNTTGAPTYTPTLTNTQTPTATNTATATNTLTPTVTPSGGHGPLVMDFENNTGNDHTYWDTTAGTCFTAVDAYGSTLSPNPWLVSSGVAPGAGNSSNYCGCISGSLQLDGPPNYPFAQLNMELIAGGSLSAGGGPSVNITPYVTNNGLKFKYKATVITTYRVAFIQSTVTDYGVFKYDFTPTDLNWHTLNVYFPGSGGSPAFAKAYGTTPWDPTKIGAVEFYPLPIAGSTHNYGICVDDVTFAADPIPTPTPTYTAGTSTMIADFEEAGTTGNDKTLAPFTGEVAFNLDAFGSTITENPWGPNSRDGSGQRIGFLWHGASTAPSCKTARRIIPSPSSAWPSPRRQHVDGWRSGAAPAGPCYKDVTTYTPNNSITFDYKAGVANVQYRIAVVMEGVTDYGHYQYIWTPTDTAWHTMTVYFPGAGSPALSQPTWAAPVTWNKTALGCIQFYPIRPGWRQSAL